MSEKTNKQPGIEQKKLQNVDISKLAANPSELSGFVCLPALSSRLITN